MKKACIFINHVEGLTTGLGEAARGRSFPRQSRGTSCFAGRFLTVFAALLLAACGTTADKLPPGPALSVSPNNVVVFGKVEVTPGVGWLYDGDDQGEFDERRWGWLDLVPPSKKSDITIRVNFNNEDEDNEYFYAIIPRDELNHNYAFHLVKAFHFYGIGKITCRGKVRFHVPQDASAVYVGTLFFEHTVKRGFLLVVKDDYDQAIPRLRERNPDFSGSIVKSLFRFSWYGVRRHPASGVAATRCYIKERECWLCPLLIII